MINKKKTLLTGFSVMAALILTACGSSSEQGKNVVNTETGINTTAGENVEKPDFSKITKLSVWVADEELFTENKEIIEQLFRKDCTYEPAEDYENIYEGGWQFEAYDGEEKIHTIVVTGPDMMGINKKWYKISRQPECIEIVEKIEQENGVPRIRRYDPSEITRLSIWVADEENFTENIELIQQLFDGQCKYKPLEDYVNQTEGGLFFTAYNTDEVVCYITVVKGNIFGIKWKDEAAPLWYEVSSNPDYAGIDRQIRKENGIEISEE